MRGQRKNPRKAGQPFENKKRKIDIFKNYEANGVEKIQRKLEIFSTLISKKSIFNLLNKFDIVYSEMITRLNKKRFYYFGFLLKSYFYKFSQKNSVFYSIG